MRKGEICDLSDCSMENREELKSRRADELQKNHVSWLKTQVVLKRLREHDAEVTVLLSQGLNPIEHLWDVAQQDQEHLKKSPLII